MSTTIDPGAALCDPFLAAFAVDGVSISVVSDHGAQSTIGTSDALASRIDDLQFQLGEGPMHDVVRTGRLSFDPDLRSASTQRTWPLFASAAVDAGVRGLLSVPLLIGRTAIGAVSMYALGLLPPWSESDLRKASGLADRTVQPAMSLATRAARSEVAGRTGTVEMRREVHQATGMISVQLGCGIDEALIRLRAHAFAEGISVDEVARAVVARTLRFTTLDD